MSSRDVQRDPGVAWILPAYHQYRVPGHGDKGLHAGEGAPRVDIVHVEMGGPFPRTWWQYV